MGAFESKIRNTCAQKIGLVFIQATYFNEISGVPHMGLTSQIWKITLLGDENSLPKLNYYDSLNLSLTFLPQSWFSQTWVPSMYVISYLLNIPPCSTEPWSYGRKSNMCNMDEHGFSKKMLNTVAAVDSWWSFQS